MSTEPVKEAPVQATPASAAAGTLKPAEVEEYPDPDEDDLDDLDGRAADTLMTTSGSQADKWCLRYAR